MRDVASSERGVSLSSLPLFHFPFFRGSRIPRTGSPFRTCPKPWQSETFFIAAPSFFFFQNSDILTKRKIVRFGKVIEIFPMRLIFRRNVFYVTILFWKSFFVFESLFSSLVWNKLFDILTFIDIGTFRFFFNVIEKFWIPSQYFSRTHLMMLS